MAVPGSGPAGPGPADHGSTLTADDATRLAREVYGVVAPAVAVGRRSQSFRLQMDGVPAYLLTVAASPMDPGRVDAEDQAAARAREAGLAAPSPVRTADGAAYATRGGRGVRLRRWLPGVPTGQSGPAPAGQLCHLGGVLGRLARALEGFDHPAVTAAGVPDLARAGTWLEMRRAAGVPARRDLLTDLRDRLHADVEPRLTGLRRSVVYGGATDRHVLVGPDGLVCGLLGFHHLGRGTVAASLALAAACLVRRSQDPLTGVRDLVVGFHAEYPLAEAEVDVLWELVRAAQGFAACQPAVGEDARPGDPQQDPGQGLPWQALARMRAIHPRLARYRLRDACGLPAHPAGERVRRYLAASAAAPLLAGLPGAKVFAVDLSASSATVGPDDAGAAPARFDRLIRSVVGGDAAAIGVGGYGEDRLIYTGPGFAPGHDAAPGHDGDMPAERRTVHLGVDVWTPPGLPVRTPLAGTVVVARDNVARLDYGPVVVLAHVTDDGERFYTLYGHLARRTLERVRVGAGLAAGDLVGWVGTPPSNGDWAPHVHLQVIIDLLDLAHDYPGVCEASQQSTWLGLSPDPQLLLRLSPPEWPAPG